MSCDCNNTNPMLNDSAKSSFDVSKMTSLEGVTMFAVGGAAVFAFTKFLKRKKGRK